MDFDMHPEDVKAALRKRGTSLAELARAHGVTISIPASALRRSLPKWEGIIAAALGMDPATIWPSRYAERAEKAALRARTSAEVAAARAMPRRRGRPRKIQAEAA